MRIVFNLPHVFLSGSSSVENARALRSLLDCMVQLNVSYLKDNKAPTIYKAGVVYARTQWWEPIPAVIERGYGDCKSLAPWLIAQYRKAYIPCEPVFRWVKKPDGGTDYHILVQTENGFEDPSRILGMGKNENAR
jgi:hypothetical protein